VRSVIQKEKGRYIIKMEKTYTNAIKLTEDTWKHGTKTQKKELLETRGLNESWAETKTIQEMVKKGGGMVAKDLKNLHLAYLKRNGGKVTINWD
jgi:hypothetical protein